MLSLFNMRDMFMRYKSIILLILDSILFNIVSIVSIKRRKSLKIEYFRFMVL